MATGEAFPNTWDSSSDWAREVLKMVIKGKLDSLLGGGKGNVPEPREESLKDVPQRAPSFC